MTRTIKHVAPVAQQRYWSIDCVFGHHPSCPDQRRDIYPPCDCACHKPKAHALRIIDGGRK